MYQFYTVVFSSNLGGCSHSPHLIAGAIIWHQLVPNQLWLALLKYLAVPVHPDVHFFLLRL